MATSHIYRQILAAALVPIGFAACSQRPAEQSRVPEREISFRNVDRIAAFVGDEACFDCHEEQYTGYQDHAMARSYYPLTRENRVEDIDDVIIRDTSSTLIYTVEEIGGVLYQVEYDGSVDSPRNVLRRRMDYVVGSGNAARTYLNEENGRLYELPLTWYTQRGRWDFSPGYAIANHRFSRLVPDRCMACHNGYPEPVPFVEGKYREVPNGIGCERCHGPGGLHVAERLEVPEPVAEIDDSIVNPAHLPFERRLDVCQQCHLNATVSILREGRGAFGFRPSQALEDFVALFARGKVGSGDEIDVISHADRMRQSACFLATAESETPMECTTCHDPHAAFRDEGPGYFNQTCIACHSVEALASRLSAQADAASHSADANCIDCHMPRVDAEDAPHSSFTDHWIRVIDDDDIRVGPESSRDAGDLRAYFERDRDSEDGEIYKAMAGIVYGRQIERPDILREGAAALTDLLQGDTTRAEAHYLRGIALYRLREVEASLPSFETAVRLTPNDPIRLNGLAQAYESAGRSAITINRLYRRALAIQPAASEIRVNYGRFLQAQGRNNEAEEQYRLAIDEDPWLAVAYHNLGTLQLAEGDRVTAASSFREALRIDPFYSDAMGNLAALAAMEGREAEAEELFARAVEVAPANPKALGNLGAKRLNDGRLGDAIQLLRRAVAADSTFVDGLANLALAYFRAEDPARARDTAERALRLDPSHALARQVLVATD